ncbi:MAG: PilZ domain-containing protein [Deltaproteobacteria bacterium]|nr:PilZ domain-containing protein [Deltaproteobacteria bacterium]
MQNINNLVSERRRERRLKVDLKVTRQSGIDDLACLAENISATGIKIRKRAESLPSTSICNLELHLVPGSISTVVAGRCVWQNSDYESFEFISPSFSQQVIIERLTGNL